MVFANSRKSITVRPFLIEALTVPALSIAVMGVFYKKRLRFSTYGYIIVKDIHTELKNCKNCGKDNITPAEAVVKMMFHAMPESLKKSTLDESLKPV